MKLKVLLAAAAAAALAVPFASVAQTAPDGEALFNARCKMCHEPAMSGAPDKAKMATMAHAQLVSVLTDGAMAAMSDGMSAEEKAAVATFLTKGAAAAPAADAAAPAAAPAAPAAEHQH